MRRDRTLRRAFGAAFLGLLLPLAPAAAQEEADGTVVFLVRHAETVPDGTRDPALSADGQTRAGRLAALLADAGLDAVYTTDYARTRGTAGAVAERLGLDVTVYDPVRLGTFAEALEARGGRVLVVGHSNTTPELVTALGGRPGAPIEETEHDRLYVLVGSDEAVRTVVLRY
jgi:broad specificity phosphatase PhoE